MNPSTQRNQIKKSSQPDQDTYVRLLSDFTDDIENSVPTPKTPLILALLYSCYSCATPTLPLPPASALANLEAILLLHFHPPVVRSLLIRDEGTFEHERLRAQLADNLILAGATATRPGALIGAMLYEHWEFQVFPPIQGSKRVRLDLVVNLEHIKRAAGDSEPKKFAFREGDMLSYDPIIPALALAFSDVAFLNCFSTPEAIYNLKVPPNRTDFAFCGKKNGKDAPYFETLDCQSICFGSAPQQDLIHLAARLQRHDAAPTCLTEEQLAEVNGDKDLKALRLARTNAMQTWKAQGYRSRDAAAGTTMREDYDRYSKEAENLSKYLKGIRLRQVL
ncbi:hypothetical protein ARSEF4850_008803 [Beauveria asiatica]